MPRKHKITLRTGSTAPNPVDFAVSEPAWDSTNKKFYIKAADNTMTEIGGGGGGSITIGISAADILDATGSTITADDAGSDKIVFWDDSASKLTYLAVGSGLSISGTEITASAGGGGIDPVIAGMIF